MDSGFWGWTEGRWSQSDGQWSEAVPFSVETYHLLRDFFDALREGVVAGWPTHTGAGGAGPRRRLHSDRGVQLNLRLAGENGLYLGWYPAELDKQMK